MRELVSCMVDKLAKHLLIAGSVFDEGAQCFTKPPIGISVFHNPTQEIEGEITFSCTKTLLV